MAVYRQEIAEGEGQNRGNFPIRVTPPARAACKCGIGRPFRRCFVHPLALSAPCLMSPAETRPLVHVLVVEDSEDDYHLLLLQLRKAPFSVQSERIETLAELRRTLVQRTWDVVISDHNLPGFTSTDALNEVKQLSPDTPFIIMSGAIGEDAAVLAMQNGADDYVMKHRPHRLVPAIERALRNASERRERRLAEQAVFMANRRLKAISANIPGLILRLTWDPETANLGLAYSSGGSLCSDPEQHHPPIQTIDDLLALFAPETVRDLKSAVIEAARQPDRALRWEGQVLGHCCVQWILLSTTRDSSALAWDGLLTDITPEKMALEAAAAARRETSRLIAHQDSVKEAERAEIAREIHDDIGGLLTGIKTDVVWLRKRLSDDGEAQGKLADVSELLEQVVQSSKRIARALRPAILDQGLPAALEWQAREFSQRSGIACSFKTNHDNLRLDPGSATGVFRIVQEALTNVSKHSVADKVDVQLFSNDSNVTLEVHDNGKGVQPADLDKPDSFGLRGMRERIEQLGGWIEVNGSPGKGTTIMLSIPKRVESNREKP